MYQQQVDRSNPGCILFLVDHSFSMTDSFAGSPRSKCDAVATAINRFISELITMCEKGEEKPRHYFDVGVIGYTTDKKAIPIIGPALGGALAGRDLVSIVELYDNPLDMEERERDQDDGAGGLIKVKFTMPIWYRKPSPDMMAGTPMCGVFQYVKPILEYWCSSHPNSFPPIVINITDGESTDGDPEPAAADLRGVSTSDGNVLLYNCHLSSSEAEGVFLPDSESQLPDEFSRMLFRMSSPLTQKQRELAEVKNLRATVNSRGMAFNADGTKMLQLISVGTVAVAIDPSLLR